MNDIAKRRIVLRECHKVLNKIHSALINIWYGDLMEEISIPPVPGGLPKDRQIAAADKAIEEAKKRKAEARLRDMERRIKELRARALGQTLPSSSRHMGHF